MARTAVLGLPRMGANRELKFALESFWAGQHRLRGARSDRPRAARRQLAAREGRRDRRDPVRRLLALRPRARHGVGAGRGRPRRGLLRARPRHRDAQAARADEMARHELPLPRAGAVARPPVRARQLALDGAAARGRGARDRDPPGGARAVQLPAVVQGRESARWRSSSPSTRSCSASSGPGATEVQLDEPCLALDRTARELDAFADAFTAFARAIDICLATYFAPADPRVFSLARRRAPRRPRARAGAVAGGAGDARPALARRARRPQRVGRRPRPGARPDRRRGGGARLRSRHDRAVVLAAARPVRSRARGRSRSGRGWPSRPRSSTSWAC